MQHVAERVRSFMYDELYLPAVADWPEGRARPALGFFIVGYSPEATMAEEYQFLITEDGACSPVEPIQPTESSGVSWNGEPDAISRLLLGHGTGLPEVLSNHLGVPADQVRPAINLIQGALGLPLVQPAMPFQDAIDLAEFLVDLTIKVSRFAPVPPTVGGPIEVAGTASTKGSSGYAASTTIRRLSIEPSLPISSRRDEAPSKEVELGDPLIRPAHSSVATTSIPGTWHRPEGQAFRLEIDPDRLLPLDRSQ